MTVSLSRVATEYLRNIGELEAARDIYTNERDALLDELGGLLLEHAARAKHTVSDKKREEGWFDVDVDGKYVAVRAKGGDRRSSGYSVAIGENHGTTGVLAVLWFHLNVTPARRQRLELARLESELGGIDSFLDGRWLYFRAAAQKASDFDLPAFRQQLAQLPGLFTLADDWVAKRWPSSE